MNFRSDVSSSETRPIGAKAWINEIESAKYVADLKTSFTLTGATLQRDFEVLESKTASGNGDFKRRVFIPVEAAEREQRCLTGRHVEWMIYEDFKVSDFDESVVDLNEILKVDSKNENVKSLNTRWDDTLIARKKQLHNEIQDNLYYRQLQQSEQLKPLLSPYVQGSLSSLFEQKVSLVQATQALLDCEEDAKNVCRLDQLAKYAHGLRARVETDAILSPFLCVGALLEDGGAGKNWVTRLLICGEESVEVFDPKIRSSFCRAPRYSLNLNLRKSSKLAGSVPRSRQALGRSQCASRRPCAHCHSPRTLSSCL